MKNTLLFLFLFGELAACNNATDDSDTPETSRIEFVGVEEHGSPLQVSYYSVDPENSTVEKINTLTSVQWVKQGVFTSDNINNRFILETNLGITIVNVVDGSIVNAFGGISEIEFNPVDGFLYGIPSSGNGSFSFAKADLSTGEITVIKELPEVTTLRQGCSTFDYEGERYCFIAQPLGVVVLDANTGSILNHFHGISEIEYDPGTGKLIGLSEGPNRNLVSADMDSGVITVLGETGIDGVFQGVTTFNPVKNFYIVKTEKGLTVIDVTSGAIINHLDGLTEIEYLNTFLN